MDVANKRMRLLELSDQLRDVTFSNALVASYMKDTGYLRKNILDREIEGPSALIRKWGMGYDVDMTQIHPLGKIAVLLPFNEINSLVARTICSSYLMGNKTIVKLSGKLKYAAPYFRQLLLNHIPDVEFAPENHSSCEFLWDCLSSPEIAAIVVYGNDKWIWSYKNAVRQSGKKLLFEGPGNDPQIILPDTDIDMAVEDAVKGGLRNGGQSCSSAERFFVHRDLLDEFVGKLRDRLESVRIGCPEDDTADLGPVSSDVFLNRMISHIIDARHKGAKILMGGKPVEMEGAIKFSFPPTIVTECTTDMRIVQEENFGPLFPVVAFSSEKELISGLDQSNYGLHASIYGNPSENLSAYMNRNYRISFLNSAVPGLNEDSLTVDGGFRNSGFVWEWKNNNFIHREGRRVLLNELTTQENIM